MSCIVSHVWTFLSTNCLCHQDNVSYRAIISVEIIDKNSVRKEGHAMVKLYIAIDEALVVVSQQKDKWKVDTHLVDLLPNKKS